LCNNDTVGRLYPVNIDGERCAKPRTLGTVLDPSDGQRRPSSISPHFWSKMMTKAERSQWWLDYPDATSAPKSLPSVDCSPLGISSLLSVTSRSTICTWSPFPANDSDVFTGYGPSSEEDIDLSPVLKIEKSAHGMIGMLLFRSWISLMYVTA